MKNTLIFIVIIVIIGWLIVSNSNKTDKWSLIYENNMGVMVVAGDYTSREECSSKLQLARQNSSMIRPECGSNCEPPTTINGPYVCDNTFEL